MSQRLAVEVHGQDRRGAVADAAAAAAGSIRPVPSSTSQNTGVAPAWATPSADAMNVCAGTMTSSPGPDPGGHEHQPSAAVPEFTPTQCPTPQ